MATEPGKETVIMATVQEQFTWGTGRRKTAVARVRIREGTGQFIINGLRPVLTDIIKAGQ